MGRSPGKWIKGLFGKKLSKSNLSKGREVALKPANRGESLISTKVSVPESTVDHSSISQPAPSFHASNVAGSKRGISAKQPSNGVLLSSVKDDSAQSITNLNPEEDAAKLRHVAAIKAQAAFRGYRARRAFRTLKGIIRLQALIRGHLVRRQAVATFHCLRGIVKLQALARGRKVRCSDIGIEVQKSCNVGMLLGAVSSGKSTSNCMDKLSNNAFVCKLLASPTILPLHIQYGSGEPNSDWEWLERWTTLRFWVQPKSGGKKPKKQSLSKSQAERDGRPKRIVRKPISDNGFDRSSSGSEKPKRIPRKVPSHPADAVQEHSQNEAEKVKRGIRSISSTKEVGKVDNEKRKHIIKKTPSPTVVDTLDLSNGDVAEPVPKQPEGDASPIPLPVEEKCDDPARAIQLEENKGDSETRGGIVKEFKSKDNLVMNGNPKTSQRRASLPAKIDQPENGTHNTPLKVPSYMAPTESANAKLRGQGSPRVAAAHDMVEKNEMTRRHSLPSSTMSPRVPKLVQSAGKGVIRTDSSLSSSRDNFERVEWKR